MFIDRAVVAILPLSAPEWVQAFKYQGCLVMLLGTGRSCAPKDSNEHHHIVA